MGQEGERTVRHFEIEEWIDFVRGQGAKEKREAMEQHLQSECAKCKETLAIWSGVTERAMNEKLYEPPDSAVRAVKGIGALQGLPASRSPLTIIAELVLDTLRQPALAGVRASGMAPQSLLYRVGRVHIDLRVDHMPNSARLSVVGQVMEVAESSQAIADAEIAVLGVGGKKEKTRTNRFGEFQLEFEPEDKLYLAARIRNGLEILVPLGRTLDGTEVEARF